MSEWVQILLSVWGGMASFLAVVVVPMARWWSKRAERWDHAAAWFDADSPVAEAAGGSVPQQLRQHRLAIASFGELSELKAKIQSIENHLWNHRKDTD
jgi:hypothetical protein